MKLWHYIQGSRKGKEAHRIEKEAMSDPFLADALEGYENVQGNHQREVVRLQKEVNRRQKGITNKSLGKRTNNLKAWSIAASVLIVAGVGVWFLLDDSTMTQEGLYAEEVKTEGVKTEEIVPKEIGIEAMPDSIGTASEKSIIADAKPAVVAKPQQTKADVKPVMAAKLQQTDLSESDNSKPHPVVGREAYMDYVRRNLKRPTDDECRNAKGSVVVVFKIGQSGRPYNIRVTQGLCSSTNKEAIRLIINGPNWTKGSTSDEATITINF